MKLITSTTQLLFRFSLFSAGFAAASSSQWQQVHDPLMGAVGDRFGYSIALSSNGKTVAVGSLAAPGKKAHVQVYQEVSTGWIEHHAPILSFDSSEIITLSLSHDAKTLVVGKPYGGKEYHSGEFSIFRDSGCSWNRVTTRSGDRENDLLGASVAISGDGRTVAAGAPGDVFGPEERPGYVEIIREAPAYDYWLNPWHSVHSRIYGGIGSEHLGYSVSLSDDGKVVAAGAPYFDGGRGQVRLYHEGSNRWIQTYEAIVGEERGYFFGTSISLSGDGKTLATGATGTKNWSSTSSDLVFENYDGSDGGQVKVYREGPSSWIQLHQTIVGPDFHNGNGDGYGYNIAMSSDGRTIAFSAFRVDNMGNNSGNVLVFQEESDRWIQVHETIPQEANDDSWGSAIALSGDASTIAVGGYMNDDNGIDSGYARIFKNSDISPSSHTDLAPVWSNWKPLTFEMQVDEVALETSYGISYHWEDKWYDITSGSFRKQGAHTYSQCQPANGCYRLKLFDSENSGIEQLDFSFNGESYSGGDELDYGDEDWMYFYAGSCRHLEPSQSPTLYPTQGPTSNPTLSSKVLPTASPTLFSTISPTITCKPNEKLLTFDMQVDKNGARENRYQIYTYNHEKSKFKFIKKGFPLENNGSYSFNKCISVNKCIKLTIVDKKRDGFGYFSFSFNGESYSGGEHGNYPEANSWTHFYAGKCDFLDGGSPTSSPTSYLTSVPTLYPTLTPTLEPTMEPTLSPTASPTQPVCSNSNHKEISFDMQVDENGASDNSYRIQYYNAQRGRFMFLKNVKKMENNGSYSYRSCRPKRSCYRLGILDRSKNGFGHFSFSFDGTSYSGGEPENYPNQRWIYYYVGQCEGIV